MAAINLVELQTINFSVYINGNRHLGQATVDLPELNYMTNEISGAGIAGKTEHPTRGHLENIQPTLHWRNLTANPAVLYGNGKDAIQLSLRGSGETYDAAKGVRKSKAVRVDLRGFMVQMNMGKFEVGEQTETETQLNCDYISIKIGGEEVFVHDTYNFIEKVNGVDVLDDVRGDLGL